ncbi:MAG: hypothetical protein AB3N16_11175 [Flavobacteriaceae bacterium]
MKEEQWIQKYVHEQLSDAEREHFEAQLKKDASLQNKVRDYENMQRAVAHYEKGELKELLRQTEATVTYGNGRRGWWKIAASFIVLLGLASVLWLQRGVDNKALYTHYFEPYPNTLKPVVRGAGDAKDMAFLHYENERFEEAAQNFKELLEEREDNDVRFYYALSLLGNHNFEKGKIELKGLWSSKTRYVPQVLWYLGLLEIREGNNEQAIAYLTQLLASSSRYKEKEAEALVQELGG